jgi:predicted secreted Zn-dependent protease
MSFPFRISFPFDILETRMRAVPPPLLFALALLAVLVLAQGRALAWTAAEQVRTYPVSGQSGPELYRSIGANGPVISGDRRTIAHTTFKLTWGRDYREQADGSCVIARNVPKLIITYTLPKPRGGCRQAVASSWKRFYDGLLLHEKVHGQHIIEMVQAIEAVSVGLSAPNDPGCQKVRAELQTHLKRLSDEQRARGREFDRVEMGDGGAVHSLVLGLVNGP